MQLDATCPVCSCAEVRLVASKCVREMWYRVYQCVNVECLHGFVWPLPEEAFLTAVYKDDPNLNSYMLSEESSK